MCFVLFNELFVLPYVFFYDVVVGLPSERIWVIMGISIVDFLFVGGVTFVGLELFFEEDVP